jgi:Outer membrane protein beta-barrel domain
LNLGGIVYTQLGKNIAASIEILYSQKGSRSSGGMRQSGTGRYMINKYNIKLNYAEIPIQINYFDKRKSHFGAGFSYSQLIASTEDVEANIPVTNHITGAPVDFEKDYPFRKFDVNFLLCGNLKLYKGLFLQARFQYSLLPVRKGIHPEFGRAEQYNNMWALRLMYLFQ